jgi:hypothetical protein
MLFGFAPWIVYWALVGNVPFAVAALVGLAIALGASVINHAAGKPAGVLEIGSVGTLLVVTVLAFKLDRALLERWIQPAAMAGIFAATLAGALMGKPFVREFAAAEQPPDVVKTDLFGRMAAILTWIWVAAFAGMTVSAIVPAIAQSDATLLDTRTPLSYVGYWVIPFALFGAAALATGYVPGRILAGIADVARETSFVAYDEATIDELYYLAQEHANREVGPGKEAYNVKVGGMGTPLTGDEARKSWPSTYKVRDKKA